MGGRRLRPNIANVPRRSALRHDPVRYYGGAEKAIEAGVAIAGGHTIQDKGAEVRAGGAGNGGPAAPTCQSGAQPATVDPDQAAGSGRGHQPSCDLTSDEQLAAATASMMQLNRRDRGTLAASACAATDITRQGCWARIRDAAGRGDIWGRRAASHPSFRIYFDRLPWLPGAQQLATTGFIPAARNNNRKHFRPVGAFRRQRISGGDASALLLRDQRRPADGRPAASCRWRCGVLASLPSARVIGEVIASARTGYRRDSGGLRKSRGSADRNVACLSKEVGGRRDRRSSHLPPDFRLP